MNNLGKINNLRNRYFALRHGESKANELRLIQSDPAEGVYNFGLSDNGKDQVKRSILNYKTLDNQTIIYSSDFLRAKQTAEITKDLISAKDLILTKNLRERYFGNWDKTINNNYAHVWEDDKYDSLHKNNDVESVQEVLSRTTELISQLEKKFNHEKIVLVSHGDTLQILQTIFLGIYPSKHREIPHLNTAEIRELKIA